MQIPPSDKQYLVILTSLECKSFFDNSSEPIAKFSPENLQVAYTLSLIVKSKDEIDVQVEMRYEEKGHTFSGICLVHHFKVPQLSEILSINESTHEISVDDSLLLTTLPLAVSTARGYFSAKLEGSPLHAYPFPILQTKELVSTCRMMVSGR